MKNGLVLIFNRKEPNYNYVYNLIEVNTQQTDIHNNLTHVLNISPKEFTINVNEQDFNVSEKIAAELIEQKNKGIYLYCFNSQLCTFCPIMNKINVMVNSSQLETRLTELLYAQFIFL
jgi:hypothetical protein